jgi:hypothetical protein
VGRGVACCTQPRQSLYVPLPRFRFDIRRLSFDLDVMQVQQASSSILLVCCTQFELILRPRSDRASNDASICPRRPPTPTRRGPPRTPLSGVAASSPSASFLRRLMPIPNTRLQTGHPTVRVVLLYHYVSISPATRSHCECAFLGGPRSIIPSTPYPLYAHASCAWCSASRGRDDAAPSWPCRR